MEKTDRRTSVGVVDPYRYVDRCDHLTEDGENKCRFASMGRCDDESFVAELERRDMVCPVAGEPSFDAATGPWSWSDCPFFRCCNRERSCMRCGLEEKRIANSDKRPLLEEHHLSYASDEGHEITVYICRWCHAKIHNSWARLDDEASPDPEAVAELEARRSREIEEFEFRSALEDVDE